MSQDNGSANTAIIAILVILLVVVIGFFVLRNDGAVTSDEPDIELEVNPDEGGSEGGESGESSSPSSQAQPLPLEHAVWA